MSSPTILVIDDTLSDVYILRYALDRQFDEYELEVMNSGKEALRFVQEQRIGKREPEPCVIVLDLHLPQHHGLEILRGIRETPPMSHITVVVLTGSKDPAQARAAEELGAIYREKPLDITGYIALAAEIMAICKRFATAAV